MPEKADKVLRRDFKMSLLLSKAACEDKTATFNNFSELGFYDILQIVLKQRLIIILVDQTLESYD